MTVVAVQYNIWYREYHLLLFICIVVVVVSVSACTIRSLLSNYYSIYIEVLIEMYTR